MVCFVIQLPEVEASVHDVHLELVENYEVVPKNPKYGERDNHAESVQDVENAVFGNEGPNVDEWSRELSQEAQLADWADEATNFDRVAAANDADEVVHYILGLCASLWS